MTHIPLFVCITFLCMVPLLKNGICLGSNPYWIRVTLNPDGDWDILWTVTGHFWNTHTTQGHPEDGKETHFDAKSPFPEWPGSTGLHSPQRGVRVRVILESPKQVPGEAETVGTNWPGSTGLRSPQRWVRVRVGISPESPKHPPNEQHEYTATDHLSHLCHYIAQVNMTCLLCRAGQTLWLFCITWIALGLWRNGKRPQRQARQPMASSSVETDSWKKDILLKADLLCRIEANADLLARTLRCEYSMYRKALQQQHSNRMAPE